MRLNLGAIRMENGLSMCRILSRGLIRICSKKKDWTLIHQICWTIKSQQAPKIWMQRAGRGWELSSSRVKMPMIRSQEERAEKEQAMRSLILFSTHSQERVVNKGTRELKAQLWHKFWSKTKFLQNNLLKTILRIIKSPDRVARVQALFLLSHRLRDREEDKAPLVPLLQRIKLDKGREALLL